MRFRDIHIRCGSCQSLFTFNAYAWYLMTPSLLLSLRLWLTSISIALIKMFTIIISVISPEMEIISLYSHSIYGLINMRI